MDPMTRWKIPQDGRPFGNCYRVSERLMAGQYPIRYRDPGGSRERLEGLLDEGVTTFLDLTEERELDPYAGLMAELSAARGLTTSHRRFPLRDQGLPNSPAEMRAILDAIDLDMDRGQTVYVHCWGGIGRTGTVVGCHLVRHGLTGRQALDQLTWYWSHVEKREPTGRRKGTPETPEQHRWILEWTEDLD